jgi:hypothetical protein
MSTFHLTGEHNFSRRNGEENDNNSWRKNTFGGLEETSLLCKFSMHFSSFISKPRNLSRLVLVLPLVVSSLYRKDLVTCYACNTSNNLFEVVTLNVHCVYNIKSTLMIRHARA